MCARINYVAPVTLVLHHMDDCLAVKFSVLFIGNYLFNLILIRSFIA